MARKQVTKEERKWNTIIILLFIAMTVCMLGYAFILSITFERFVGKAQSSYGVTDTSIVVDLEEYKYALVKGFITNEGENPRWFYYETESSIIQKEDILKAQGASLDANISLAKIIIVSNWTHSWLHEFIYVTGVLSMFIMPIPFCKVITKIEDEKLNKGEKQKEEVQSI